MSDTEEDLTILSPNSFLAMMNPSFKILPDVFSFDHPEVAVTHCNEDQLESALPAFQESIEEAVVGLAPVYDEKCRLTTLAIASDTQVLIIALSADTSQPLVQKTKKKNPEPPRHRELLQDFLNDERVTKFAFLMDRLTAGLFLDHHLRIVRAKDLLTVSTEKRHSNYAYFDALGGYRCLNIPAVKKLFEHEETHVNEPRVTALQAWAAYSTACFEDMQQRHSQIPPIDTLNLDTRVMSLISSTVRNIYSRIALKPLRVRNDVQAKYNHESKKLVVTSERYKTRILRPSGSQVYNIVADKADGSQQEYRGRAVRVSGRTSIFEVSGDIATTVIRGMETVGREKPTAAESTKERYMLDALQGRIDLSANDLVMSLWFRPIPVKKTKPKPKPKEKKKSKKNKGMPSPEEPECVDLPPPPPPPPIVYSGPLNGSQEEAVNKILSNELDDRVVLIKGPPGTGKTTVIAAAVSSIIASPQMDATVWLVAYSNVAVKNMAEKLASVNFQDFKILVSKDFHFDWHEHLYEKIESNLIRSDELIDDAVATERQLRGSRVVICTLSLLSNDKISNITRQVPLQTVLFDEASQIEMGDYIPMLLRYHHSLGKLVFIGDDKQLAPHGSQEVKSLKSVFKKSHLEERAVFLDTQYRMPVPLGTFISAKVYRHKLNSVHPISDPESCRFVDVADGLEESRGSSWQNSREVAVVIAIARQLTATGKSFRVITPYDPQRSLLEQGLKDAGLPWKDKCFNVDAFQGNEDDYIVVSLVRTAKLGFLFDRSRANVMLTRCKKGLMICTQRRFVEGPAEASLIGELCQSFEEPPWVDGKDVLSNRVQPFL